MFDTDPAKREHLTSIVYDVIKNLSTDGPSEININTTKANLLKTYQEGLKTNQFWMDAIYARTVFGVDKYTAVDKLISSITPERIKAFAKQIFSQGNILEYSLNPEK
jgi:zinc protease